MEENKDETRSTKKSNSSGWSFSMSLPAALQRVFKKPAVVRKDSHESIDSAKAEDQSSTNRQGSDTPENVKSLSNDDLKKDDKLSAFDKTLVSTKIKSEINTKKDLNSSTSSHLSTITDIHSDEKMNCIKTLNGKKAVSELISATAPPVTAGSGVLINMEKEVVIQTTEPKAEIIDPRKVTFNNTIITTVYEPPDLLIGSISMETVADNYVKICEKYKTKPFDRIVKTLRESDDSLERIPLLCFTGYRLDYKSCECLEEIFKYVRFDMLDFQSTQLEDEGFIAICEMCEYYDTTRKLCFNMNPKVSMRGFLAVAQLITKSTFLELINLSHTVFTEQILNLLTKSFKNSISLKTLYLEGCYLNGNRLQCVLNAACSNKNITELYLGENKIGVNDEKILTDFFVANNTVRILDLRNNSLQDSGIASLTRAILHQQAAGVEVLHLWNNYITSCGVKTFAEVVASHPSLHTINFGKNKFGDEGVIHLKFAFMKNKNLQRIGLSNCRISDTGAVALAEYVADTKKLLRLDIRENSIGLAGLIALSQAMQVNYSIFKLDFNRHIKVQSCMTELASRLIEDIRICCLRNRQLSKGGPMEEIMSLASVLSDEHSITQSLRSLPPSAVPSPQKSADGTMTSFWQLISRFTKAKSTNSVPLSTSPVSTENDVEDKKHEIAPLNDVSIAVDENVTPVNNSDDMSILGSFDYNLENTQEFMLDKSAPTLNSETLDDANYIKDQFNNIKPINGVGRFVITTVKSSFDDQDENQTEENAASISSPNVSID